MSIRRAAVVISTYAIVNRIKFSSWKFSKYALYREKESMGRLTFVYVTICIGEKRSLECKLLHKS